MYDQSPRESEISMSNEDRVRKTVMVNADLCESLAGQMGDLTFTEMFNRLAEAQVNGVIDVTSQVRSPELILATGIDRAIADRMSAEADLMRAQAAVLRKDEHVESPEIVIDEDVIRFKVEEIVDEVMNERKEALVDELAGCLSGAQSMIDEACKRMTEKYDEIVGLLKDMPAEQAQDVTEEVKDGYAETTPALDDDVIETPETDLEVGTGDAELAVETEASVEDRPVEAPEEGEPEGDGLEGSGDEGAEPDLEDGEGEEEGSGDTDGEGGDPVGDTGDGEGSSDGQDGGAGGRQYIYEAPTVEVSAEAANVTGEAGENMLRDGLEDLLAPDASEFADMPEDDAQYGFPR